MAVYLRVPFENIFMWSISLKADPAKPRGRRYKATFDQDTYITNVALAAIVSADNVKARTSLAIVLNRGEVDSASQTEIIVGNFTPALAESVICTIKLDASTEYHFHVIGPNSIDLLGYTVSSSDASESNFRGSVTPSTPVPKALKDKGPGSQSEAPETPRDLPKPTTARSAPSYVNAEAGPSRIKAHPAQLLTKETTKSSHKRKADKDHSEAPLQKRGPGRPKGSKNRPKIRGPVKVEANKEDEDSEGDEYVEEVN